LRWRRADGHRRGDVVDCARRRSRLRRPHRRHAAVALSRLDHQHRPQIQFSAGAVTAGFLIRSEEEEEEEEEEERIATSAKLAQNVRLLYSSAKSSTQVFHQVLPLRLVSKSCQHVLPTNPAHKS